MNKEEIVKKMIGTIIDEDKTSYFSNNHVMDKQELVQQVWGYALEISKYYIPEDYILIGTEGRPSNGVRLVVMPIGAKPNGAQVGYACTLYAISRRNKLMEQICDMFEAGVETLSNEDIELARRGRPQEQIILPQKLIAQVAIQQDDNQEHLTNATYWCIMTMGDECRL